MTPERIERIKAALQKIDRVSNSEEMKSIYIAAHIHGCDYEGESFGEDLKQALADCDALMAPVEPGNEARELAEKLYKKLCRRGQTIPSQDCEEIIQSSLSAAFKRGCADMQNRVAATCVMAVVNKAKTGEGSLADLYDRVRSIPLTETDGGGK